MNEAEITDFDRDKRTAKFFKGFHIKEPVNLTLGVSMGNEKQKGKYFEAFINMVNLNSKNIKNLDIVVGAYLHRHYAGEEEAIKMHKDWVENAKPYLEKLGVPYKIVDWKDIVSTEEFKKDLEFVSSLYEKDPTFRTKVESVAKSHIDKGEFEVVKKYLLEECAFFKGAKRTFTYPTQKLNVACMHIISQYNPDFHYKPYVLLPPKINPNNKSINTEVISVELTSSKPKSTAPPILYPTYSNELNIRNVVRENPFLITEENNISREQFVNSCRNISYLMQQFGFHSVSQKERFFSQFLRKDEEILQLVQQGEVYDNENKTGVSETRKEITKNY